MSEIVSLADARAHLRFTTSYTQDDDMLSSIFIPAATAVIETECGHIVPQQYDEFYDGGDFSIWLRQKPLLSVELVEEGWGFTNYVLSYVQSNSIELNEAAVDPLFAYSIDMLEQGKISRRYGGNVPAPFVSGEANVHVIYTVGRESVPPNLYLAGLELVAHWYQNSQQRMASGAASGEYAYDATDSSDFTRSQGLSAINQGVPYRILELIKGKRKGPIIG